MAPTRRTAWLIGGVAILAVIVPTSLVVVLLGAVAVAVVVDGWVGRAPLRIERTIGDVLSRGVASRLEIDVADRNDRATVRQPGTPDLIVDPSISDGGLEGTVTPIRRGRHQLPSVATRVRGPLGLAQWSRSAGDHHDILVYPDMPAARRIATQVRHGVFQTEGNRIRGALGLGTAFESIREYVDGDDMRRVNWLATARSSHPMVNQYRVDQDRDVICVIDCGRLMGSPIGGMSRLDAAVDAAAAIAAVADVVGDRVGVVAFDERIRADLPPQRRGGESVARAIFDLEPSTAESHYRNVFERVANAKRAFVIVLTDLLDAAAARPLMEAIPILARKHAVAVATVADPDVAEALTTKPANAVDVARAVVAIQVTEARSTATIEIIRHGARVVDVPMERYSAACVAAYLDAKSRISF